MFTCQEKKNLHNLLYIYKFTLMLEDDTITLFNTFTSIELNKIKDDFNSFIHNTPNEKLIYKLLTKKQPSLSEQELVLNWIHKNNFLINPPHPHYPEVEGLDGFNYLLDLIEEIYLSQDPSTVHYIDDTCNSFSNIYGKLWEQFEEQNQQRLIKEKEETKKIEKENNLIQKDLYNNFKLYKKESPKRLYNLYGEERVNKLWKELKQERKDLIGLLVGSGVVIGSILIGIIIVLTCC